MKQLLIIEDDENNLLLISRLLELGGYEYRAARTGEEGLEMVFETKPDAVLLDIALPGIQGTEVLKRLRAFEIYDDLPIIAVTSSAMPGDREYLLAEGCTAYIEKPLDPEHFVAQLKAIIG
jgi:CheY-like chemotaxis protein